MFYLNLNRIFQRVAANRAVVLANVFTATFLLSACGSSQTDDVVCTTEARASVMLTVIDAQNNKLPDVSVSYSVNKTSPKTQICDSAVACVLEYEVPGEFSIMASKVGYLPASTTVNVTRGGCHVNTQLVLLTLNRAS
jgi:hypothetical protein